MRALSNFQMKSTGTNILPRILKLEENTFKSVKVLLEERKHLYVVPISPFTERKLPSLSSLLIISTYTARPPLLRLLYTTTTVRFLTSLRQFLASSDFMKKDVKREYLISRFPKGVPIRVEYTFMLLYGDYSTAISHRKEIAVIFKGSTLKGSLMFVVPMTALQNWLPTLQNILRNKNIDLSGKGPIQLEVRLSARELTALTRLLRTEVI